MSIEHLDFEPKACSVLFAATTPLGRWSDQWMCTLSPSHDGPHAWPECPLGRLIESGEGRTK